MSCFVVSFKHINTLVSAAARQAIPRVYVGHGEVLDLRNHTERQAAAEALLAENVRAVRTCYPQTVQHPESLPQPQSEIGMKIKFQWERTDGYTAAALLKLARCWQYQCDEGQPDIQGAAHRIVDHLISSIIVSLPGYDEAAWKI